MLLRLQQGPAGKQELLAAVYAEVGEDAYGYSDGNALAKRFEADKWRMREHLGIDIRYDARAGGYIIADHEVALLNLSDAHLQTLAFLADTFEPDSPHGREVQHLVATLRSWLPADRVHIFNRARGLLPDVDLRLRDSEPIAPDVWERVLWARDARQEISFDYLSADHEDGIPRQHIVEPWHVYFSERGHYRLDGYCLFNDGPNGPWYPHRFFNYRLSNIVGGSVEILPNRLPPTRRLRPYEVVYQLAPHIARFGVSPRPEFIGEPTVTQLADGWALMEAKAHDIFHLARNLLYYGAGCRVLGGPELLREMKMLVRELAGGYE